MLLSFVAIGSLVNAHIAIIAQMRLNDVIEIHASSGPLCQYRRRQPKRRNGCNQHRQNDTNAASQPTVLQGPPRPTGSGAKSSNAPRQPLPAHPPPVLGFATGGP